MFEKRLKKIMEFLSENQAVIIMDDNNRFYFTGMQSSAGTLIITKETSYFLIDFRYFEKAKQTVKNSNVILCEKMFSQTNEILKKCNINEVLLENTVSIALLENFKKNLSEYTVCGSKELTENIKKLRSIKDKEEIKYIKQAQELTDKTFEYILNRIKVGVSEREIMLDMEFFMRKMGSEGVSFDFIVVSGRNSSLPHGVPTEKLIENGDFVTMDFGAVVGGYRSDMTRTVAVGEVNKEQLKVYNTVLKAQTSALEQIKPNTKCCDIDKIARDIINNAGYNGCFGHGLGHSVGLEIHENPSFNTRDETLLESGMVLTVEPGIYLENKFGVRIEDMVVITQKGYENLTKSPKQLIVL